MMTIHSVATVRKSEISDIQPGHGYYIGASSSPSFVLVLSVGRIIRYVSARSLEVSTCERDIFGHLAGRALATLKKRSEQTAAYAASCPERERALAALCAKGSAACVASHGAPIVLSDHDRIEYRVSAPVGVDVYGLAKNVGIVGDWDDDANKISVECDRGDRVHLEAAGLTIESERVIKTCPLV